MAREIVYVVGADGGIDPFVLLDVTERAAFVCREDVYDEIISGRRARPVLGFPLEDVFGTKVEAVEGRKKSDIRLRAPAHVEA